MSDLVATGVSLISTSPLARASLPELSIEWGKEIRSRAESISKNSLVALLDFADDLEQVGLIAFWRACRTFDPGRGVPFEHYARTVIHRAMTSEVRKTKHHTAAGRALWIDDPDLDPGILPPATDPGSRHHQQAARERVRRWVSKGPPRLREVFGLLYAEGLSQREAAVLMGVTQPRISQLHRDLLRRGQAELTTEVR